MAWVKFFHLTRRHGGVAPPGFFAFSPTRGHLKVGGLDVVKHARAKVVLTPHPGEMGRLLGKTSREVQGDRLEIARTTAVNLGAWVILKGAKTVTASPDGRVVINSTGNQWMASGGQGDALSGMLGGLLVQGIAPEDALPLGVYLHGLAADRIVEQVGPAPVLACYVIDEIPELLGSWKSEM